MHHHKIALDAELGLLVASALGVGYFLSGTPASGTTFAVLLAGLFFVIGLYTDFPSYRYLHAKQRQLTVAGLSCMLVVPLVSLGFWRLSGLGVFLALAAAGPAIGVSQITVSRAGGDRDLAARASSLLTAASLGLLPFYLSLVDATGVSVNLGLSATGLLCGTVLSTFDLGYLNEIRRHSSKTVFWLVSVVGVMQLSATFASPVNLPVLLIEGVLWLALFSVLTFVTGLGMGVLSLRHGPEQRALAVLSSQRNVEITLLASTLVSGKAVLLSVVYYLMTWVVALGSVRLFSSD
nr:MAG: hypothetical protein J07AB56_01930 [Candidatus Nanosalinarum sp. J07AB56]